MSSDDMIALFANIVGAIVAIAGIVVVGWLLYRIIKFIRIAQDIHGSASRRAHGHKIPLFNIFDSTALSSKEKLLRAEAFEGLGPVLLVFLGLFCSVVLLVSLTS